jgi:hypothetical protein
MSQRANQSLSLSNAVALAGYRVRPSAFPTAAGRATKLAGVAAN